MTRGVPNTIESIRARLVPEDLGYVSLCRVWSGQVQRRTGYGKVRYQGVQYRVHRLLYVELVGPIPDGFEPDHVCHDPLVCVGGVTCRHRLCANTDHIRVVTPHENFMRSNAPAARNARKTHCVSGHLLAGENIVMRQLPHGGWYRDCVLCWRAPVG